MGQFFRCLRSLDIFACHCWTTKDTVQIGILLIKNTNLQGTICILSDGDSSQQITVQLPEDLISVSLNIQLPIKL